MNTSFYNGVSGIKTHQFGIDVWSDNIANTDLNGFKSSNPEFSTIFSTTMSDSYFNPTSNDIGLGSAAQTNTLDMSQGSLLTTDSKYDLALDSEGWFGVKAPENQTFYTRDGSFSVDRNGDLVDQNGYYVLGTSGNNITTSTVPNNVLDKLGNSYTKDGMQKATIETISDIDTITRSTVDTQTKINLPPNLYYPPEPTSNVKISTNLNPEIITDTSGNEIPNVEHFSTSIITPEGESNVLDMTFTKEVPQTSTQTTWDGKIEMLSFYEKYDAEKTYDTTQYKVYKSSNKVYKIEDSKDAKVQFNGDGKLLDSYMPTFDNGGTTLTIDAGDKNSYNGFTSVIGSDKSTSIEKDGHTYGLLSDYSIYPDGTISAEFNNGKNIPVAKIGVYHFQNDQGLSQTSATLMAESANSGKAFFYKNSDGSDLDTTSVRSNTLESSNTDMTTALTELLLMQNAYDANAKSITTSDEMIQNAINMKK
jgi:flagellar hook protein FlgE